MSAFYNKVSPAYLFLGVVLLGIALSIASILVALSQPQLDLPVGAVPARVGDIEIIASDLVEEPDQLGSYAAIQEFRERQTLIRAELDRQQLSIRYLLPDGTIEQNNFQVRQRDLADLPWTFWFQLGVGLVSLFIGGWVISLRRDDWGARMFALTALFVPVFANAAAIYSTRQIALDGALFQILSGINAFGAISFGIALVGLFSQYPKPMFRPVWLLIPAGLYGIAIILNFFSTGPDNIVGYSVLSQMLIALVLGIIQWYLSRREPLNRAGLRWFILVSLVGCSLFIFLSSAPATLGITDTGYVPQGIAFAFFNIMHVGLALGIMRYKVFNLDRWSYYIWLWLSGMILILVLDVLLIRFLQGQPWLSLGAALLIAGFLYFPLRQLLLKFLVHRRSASLKGRMAAIVGTALSPTNREHALRWDALLSDVFAPLAPPDMAGQKVDAPRIDEDGLALLIPGIEGLEPRRLRYAQRGRRLFSRDDVEVAANILQMHDLASDSRRAYERGVILERDRISRDVHDNIGAQLLSALHSREVSRKDDLLRDSLSDLRAIINDGFQAEFELLPMLADLRTEAAQRLEAHGVTLTWAGPACTTNDNGPTIPFELVNGLRSILREAVSNTLRHSGAKTVWIKISLNNSEIALDIEDDGKGLLDETRAGDGHGIPNIMDRAAVLMGFSQIGNRQEGKTGTRIQLTLPLYPDVLRSQVAQ
uniref:ATP-binding protein n=1 Tax=Pararhizobium sp. IMCC3301 TaxID=3067904 RepID=UPI0027408338|nr:ATP-binding protein [Pararhizobium sp. IMCC3301]